MVFRQVLIQMSFILTNIKTMLLVVTAEKLVYVDDKFSNLLNHTR